MNLFTSCGGVSNNIKYVINTPCGIIVQYNNVYRLLECNREDVESIIGQNISIKKCFCGCVYVMKKFEFIRYDHDDPLASLLRQVTGNTHNTFCGINMGECHIWGFTYICSVLQQQVCEMCVKFKKSI